MRPTRLLISLCFFFLTLFLTFYSLLVTHAPQRQSSAAHDHERGYRSFFSWHMPSALFPQSAIISLTDDNSTFFLSRPANYGPRLPVEGLSGQLWYGGGFSHDALSHGQAAAKGEGELGCSDIPGWDPNQLPVLAAYGDAAGAKTSDRDRTGAASLPPGQSRGPAAASGPKLDFNAGTRPKEEDGTDAYLHWPFKDTTISRAGQLLPNGRGGASEHADIQSLQESAEIAGKVVLLSRGGCGFLEKTKWVQRRGGLALIVGDNIRGGPLTTMYGNGDASNISIPSLFTTRTTAQLLSSLISSKNGDAPEDPRKEPGNAKLAAGAKDPSKTKPGPDKAQSPASKSTPRVANARRALAGAKMQRRSGADATEPRRQHNGWLASAWSKLGWRSDGSKGLAKDSSRPPSSGRLSWIVSQDWDEDVGTGPSKQPPQKDSKVKANGASDSKKAPAVDDSFVIGVQDWRDPDMMKPDPAKLEKPLDASQQGKIVVDGKVKTVPAENPLSGGSHTPGSGVYHQSDESSQAPAKSDPKAKVADQVAELDSPSDSWFGRFFGSSHDDLSEAKAAYDKTVASQYVKEKEFEEFANKPPVEHEGLWVTMTPTTISTTPFFDTLLVLVVSPLVTLTVVYALLVLRSRIRRRRWRAPKSVVDRLPVRTYHTITYSSTATSSQPTSPEASSPTSPLLRNHSRSMLNRTRPRSRTVSTLADEVSSSLDKATAKASLSTGERKRLVPKKYNGRQVECVVCLEEYVDGQSRVMSLPCGHEFHAECITPWLTTRRRTCPICKGDVVRSMNSGSASSSTTDLSSARQLRDPSDLEDVQFEAAHARNESPSAAIPIPQSGESDLERGEEDLAATLVNDQQGTPSSTWNWRELASRSLSAVRGEPSRSAQEDRTR